MQNKVDILAELSKTICFEHGISAGGKGVYTEAAEELGRQKNIVVDSISTGNLFRAATDLMISSDPGVEDMDPVVKNIAETMLRGEYIETLEQVAPNIEDALERHFCRVLRGQPSILNIDGGLRIGVAEGRKDGKYEGRMVPPQVDQIGEAGLRALKAAILNNPDIAFNVSKLDPEFLEKVLSRQDVDYGLVNRDGFGGEFTRKVVLGAKQIILEIDSVNATILMRNRFYKSVLDARDMIMSVGGGDKDSSTIVGHLNEALLLSSDHFRIQDGDIELDPTSFDFDFATMTPEHAAAADKRLQKIAESIVSIEGVGPLPDGVKLNIETSVKRYVLDKQLNITVQIRGDDQSEESRKKRAVGFQSVIKDVLTPEIGVSYSGYKVNQESMPPNVYVLQNSELSRAGYDSLVLKSKELATRMLGDQPNLTIEGSMKDLDETRPIHER